MKGKIKMGNSKEKVSKFRKMINQGCIAEFYTQKGYFCKIYPIAVLDSVKFSFKKKGVKNSDFDIYVSMPSFLLLKKDIQNYQLAKKIAADNGQYPSAWIYNTGENGAKKLAIGKSKSGTPLISGSVPETKNHEKGYALVPLQSFDDLRTMAEIFDIVTGITPVTGYWAEIKKLFEKAQLNNQKYFHNDDYDDEYDDYDNLPSGNVEETVVQTNNSPSNQQAAKVSQPAPSNNKEAEKRGKFTPLEYGAMKSGFAVKVKDGDVIIFNPEVYKKDQKQRVDQINKLLASGKMTDFTCYYAEKNDKKYFLKFA